MALRRITNFAGCPHVSLTSSAMKARKLDTSGKPEPPAEEASRGREMRKELNNLDLLNSDRGTTHGMYQSSRSDSAFN